jgi:uncharacterized protein (DUF952 family)
VIFHITTRSAWAEARSAGAYEAPSLATEGFIHTSEAHQVLRVAERFRGSADDLVLLRIDPARVAAPLRYEVGEVETGEEFPHVHGPLNLDAVVDVAPFVEGPDGFVLPG